MKEKERERNINVWLPLVHAPLGTWPTTQACALTTNQTRDPLVCRPALNPLSHTSQGSMLLISLEPFDVNYGFLMFISTLVYISEHLMHCNL